MSFIYKTAVEMSEALSKKEVSAVELANQHYERIEEDR
jgi:Asp-tRNA(Asn)/Glu-tRNA(Gln) amidotransferase A subunit family amidase